MAITLKNIFFSILMLLISAPIFANQSVLQIGDILYIGLPGEESFNQDFTIDHNGYLLLPEAGEIKIAGENFPEAKQTIKAALSVVYQDLSHLNIYLQKEKRLTVTVLGAVAEPGIIDLPSNADIQMAIFAAGGLTPEAQLERMHLRNNETDTVFNYKEYLSTGKQTIVPKLKPADELFVPSASEIRIIGEVRRPDNYSWSKDMTLLSLIALSGGPTAVADLSKIRIITTPSAKNKEPKSEEFNLQKFIHDGGSVDSLPKLGKNYTVVIPRTVLGDERKTQWINHPSDESIYILGQVGRPGRYSFDNSMSFIDILSAADGPSERADLHNIRISHQDNAHPMSYQVNLSRFFETGDMNLLPHVVAGDVVYIPGTERNWIDYSKESTVRVLGAVRRPGRYQFSLKMTILDLLAEVGGPTEEAYISRIVVVNLSRHESAARSFNLEMFVKTGDRNLLPVLRPGDTVFVPFVSQSHWRKFMLAVTDLFRILGTLRLVGVI